MTFNEAMMSGKIVQNVNWYKSKSVDMSKFDTKAEGIALTIMRDVTCPLTWGDMNSDWAICK